MKRIILIVAVIMISVSASGNASEKPPKYFEMAGQPSPLINRPQPSAALTSYLVEDFESATFPPTSWAQIVTNYDFTWSQSESYFGIIFPYSGNYMAYVDWDYNQQEGLITPTLDFTDASASLQLSFAWQANYAYMVYPQNNANYELWLSIDDGLTWSDMLWAEDSLDGFETRVWYTAEIDLSAYAGQSTIRFAWLYYGSDGDAVFLDNVIITDDTLSNLANDDCDDVAPLSLNAGSQLTFSGNNSNATNDCDSLAYPQVWAAFSTLQCLDIVIDYCNMPSNWGNVSAVLVEGCPCGNFIEYSWLSADSCGDGNVTIGFDDVSPGTYYYPIILDSSSAIGTYTIHVSGDICQSAGECDYLIGDISGDNQRLGGDVTYGVRFFKGTGSVPPDSCFLDSTASYLYAAGDCNGNCEFRGSDITRLVAYFKGTSNLRCCHFFPTSLP